MINKAKEYKVCSKTVMDNITDPDISFDSNGISNHYWNFHKRIKQHWKNCDIGEELIEKKIKLIKKQSKKGEFDCILGLSGGVDSSYMLHLMVEKYKLNPLVFHVDGGWNSEIAVNNINKLVDKLKIELYTEVINWEEMKNFQLAMFKSGVPHLDVPQDLAFIGVLYKYANKFKIKNILNGANIATESVLSPLHILYYGTDNRHIKDILRKFGTRKMETYPFSSVLYHKFYLKYIKGISTFKPLNYINFIKEDAIKELKDIYDWKPYPQKHFESRFTRFFEGYWLPKRFNFDMRRIQFSSLILSGQMDRDVALEKLMKSPIDEDLIDSEFEYIANKLDISVSELNRYLDLPKKYYWDYKNSNNFFSIAGKFYSFIAKTQRGGAF